MNYLADTSATWEFFMEIGGGVCQQALRTMIGFLVNRLPRNETLEAGRLLAGDGGPAEKVSGVFSFGPGRDDRWSVPGWIDHGASDHELVEYWRPLVPQMTEIDELGGFQLLEVRSSLPDELLMYADKLSMAHSLEVRVPYLDRTVVEYVQRLGASFKIRSGTRKWLHRQVCQNYLPPRILKRKKRGFAVNVVDEWFQSALRSQILGTAFGLKFSHVSFAQTRTRPEASRRSSIGKTR